MRHHHRCRTTPLVAAVLITLVACTGTDGAGHSPSPGPTGPSEASSTTSTTSGVAEAPAFDQTALEVLDEVVREDCTAVHARFDGRMSTELSASKLCAAWDAYQDEFGEYRSHGAPQATARAELTVVTVPLQMARRDGEFRVTFHPDESIAGLYFLRTGVPLPPG